MTSKMRRPALFVPLAGGALVLVVAALFVWLWPDDGGASDPRDLARSYLTALNDRDTDGLEKLYFPGDRSRAEDGINTLLSRYGGKKIHLTRTDVEQEFGPDMATLTLTGTSVAGPYSETFDTTKRDGSWYLVTYPI